MGRSELIIILHASVTQCSSNTWNKKEKGTKQRKKKIHEIVNKAILTQKISQKGGTYNSRNQQGPAFTHCGITG